MLPRVNHVQSGYCDHVKDVVKDAEFICVEPGNADGHFGAEIYKCYTCNKVYIGIVPLDHYLRL